MHYREVVEKSLTVSRSLWIGTADIKDLYIRSGLNSTRPFLGALSDLIGSGCEVRLLMAKEPGPNFRNDFDRYPLLIRHLEQAVCPRVHFKFFIFDLKEVYVGSANLTGAGLGMKSENNRNFEAGILTDEPEIVGQAIDQFDAVWNGSQCGNAGGNHTVHVRSPNCFNESSFKFCHAPKPKNDTHGEKTGSENDSVVNLLLKTGH